jgi:hypothetical protein
VSTPTKEEKEAMVTSIQKATGATRDTIVAAAHLAKITGDAEFAAEFIIRFPSFKASAETE